jgi:hypothetical protein
MEDHRDHDIMIADRLGGARSEMEEGTRETEGGIPEETPSRETVLDLLREETEVHSVTGSEDLLVGRAEARIGVRLVELTEEVTEADQGVRNEDRREVKEDQIEVTGETEVGLVAVRGRVWEVIDGAREVRLDAIGKYVLIQLLV